MNYSYNLKCCLKYFNPTVKTSIAKCMMLRARHFLRHMPSLNIGLKGRAALIKVEFRYPRYTCTVADYFCQGMQLTIFCHFYRAPAFKNAISVLMFGTRLFSALAD